MKHLPLLLASMLCATPSAFAQNTTSEYPRAAVTFLDAEMPVMEVAVQNKDRKYFDTTLPRVTQFIADWGAKSSRDLEIYPACTDAMTDFLGVGLCQISPPGTICEPETFIPKFKRYVEECRDAATAIDTKAAIALGGSTPPGKSFLVTLHDAADNDAPSAQAPDASFASFPLIQGSIGGKVGTAPVLYLPVTFGTSVLLPMDRLSMLVEPLAKPLSDQAKTAGLSIDPASARLARLGTFFVRTMDEGGTTFGGGFSDIKTRESIVLVYFSEKCRLHGAISEGDVVIDFELSIPAPGLHWLRFVKPEPKHWRVEIARDEIQISLWASARQP